MNYSFHPEARAEFFAAIDYYEEREEGLGQAFAAEVYLTIQHLRAFPVPGPVLEEEIRRCLIRRFEYGVLYTIEPEEIFIVAVMHLRRIPGYWKMRANMDGKT